METLIAHGDGLWTAPRAHTVLGLSIGTRMSVVRLAAGPLWLHSPVALDAQTRAALDPLGPVRFLVAPNRFHHTYLREAREVYPEAKIFGAPGLAEKRRDIAFEAILSDSPQPEWAHEIDQQVMRGVPLLNEVAFLHKASRTLILTDLAMNIRGGSPLWQRFGARLLGLYGKLAPPPEVRWLMLRDRKALRSSIERIMAWDFGRVVVAHGEVWERGGKAALQAGYAWLL
jgi:hypothetical protein